MLEGSHFPIMKDQPTASLQNHQYYVKHGQRLCRLLVLILHVIMLGFFSVKLGSSLRFKALSVEMGGWGVGQFIQLYLTYVINMLLNSSVSWTKFYSVYFVPHFAFKILWDLYDPFFPRVGLCHLRFYMFIEIID